MTTQVKERGMLFAANIRWIKVAATRIGVPAEYYAAELNAGRKFCGGCRRSLTRSSEFFGADVRTFDHLRSRCLNCENAKKKEHYRNNRARVRLRQKRYLRDNRERVYAYNATWLRTRNRSLRAELLAAYGGRCNCCGESEPLFLELDHIENDGASHRREFGNQAQVILWLKNRGWPRDRFQLLCANCNQGKNRNGGVCPHKTKFANAQC